MNTDQIKGKWTEIKGELRSKWGEITDNEFEQTKGNAAAIAGLVRQHYGDAKEDAERKVNDVINRFESAAATGSQKVKEQFRPDRKQ